MKRITTVYLEDNLINLARMEDLNVSEFVNTVLHEYLSVQSVEDINKQIEEHKKFISVLENKKKTLLLQGVSETRIEGMSKELLSELQKNYLKRREIGDNPDADFQWLTSPKNLQRCKILGKEPLEMCKELRDWYNNGRK